MNLRWRVTNSLHTWCHCWDLNLQGHTGNWRVLSPLHPPYSKRLIKAVLSRLVVWRPQVQVLPRQLAGILFSVVPSSNPRPHLQNSRLHMVCLLPVGIFNQVMLYSIKLYFVSLFLKSPTRGEDDLQAWLRFQLRTAKMKSS